jgi:decaprenylphospho-beta-D-erythro-pentofuranosid-2-ulose 2-reductase
MVLILGGRSEIGFAVADRFAAAGHLIQLASRNAVGLETERAGLAQRYGVRVSLYEFDVFDTNGLIGFVEALGGPPDVVVCAVGLLGDQAASRGDMAAATLLIRTDFEGPALVLAALADRFEARGSGSIIGISSVAGERGRASNYVYGAAKAGFTAFLSGLRNRLHGSGVQVLTVLPGFVETRMTAGRALPAWLTAAPQAVADAIFEGVTARRDIIHVKARWWPIMLVVRAVPEWLFKRSRFRHRIQLLNRPMA